MMRPLRPKLFTKAHHADREVRRLHARDLAATIVRLLPRNQAARGSKTTARHKVEAMEELAMQVAGW